MSDASPGEGSSGGTWWNPTEGPQMHPGVGLSHLRHFGLGRKFEAAGLTPRALPLPHLVAI